MGVKDRINEFISYKGISRSAFEKSCNLSNAYVRNLKDNPSSKKLEDILTVYPELNRVWLLTGEGNMITDHSIKQLVKGNGNKLSATGDANTKLLQQALDTISQMQDLLAESVRTNSQISARILTLLEAQQNK